MRISASIALQSTSSIVASVGEYQKAMVPLRATIPAILLNDLEALPGIGSTGPGGLLFLDEIHSF